MYLADYHVHSTCSPDGHQTMAQAAEAAVRQGLNELCITDHVDTLYWDDFRPRWDFDWDEARRQFRVHRWIWSSGPCTWAEKSLATWTCTILKKVTKRIMIVSSTAIWTAFWSWPGGDSFRCWVI